MSQDVRSRYPGAQPFADDDLSRRLFFGRARESALLANQILAHRLVVVYGRSGLGKSSLLNAGIAKRLRVDGCLPLMLRVNAQTPDLVRSVLAAVDESARAQGFDYQPGDDSSLWHFFKTAEFWRNDVLLTPTLILDQFEELFTLQPPDVRAAFLADLGALIRGIRPAQPEGQAQRESFSALSDRAPAVRVVLSLREDFLGSLEEAADWIPQILEQRFRLLPLSVEAAAEALVEPARVADADLATPAFEYSAEAQDLILDFLATRPNSAFGAARSGVEPFQLQLICQHVERRVTRRRRGAGLTRPVTIADLGGRKGLRAMLTSFYRNQVRSLRQPLQRRRVRRLCEEFLINTDGRRISIESSEARRQLRLRQATLDSLVERRLLRAEQRADTTYYELSHDTLVASILASRQGLGIARGLGSLTVALLLGFLTLGASAFVLAQVVALVSPSDATAVRVMKNLEPKKLIREAATAAEASKVAREGLAPQALGAVLGVIALSGLTLRSWRKGSQTLRRYDHVRSQGDRRPSTVRVTASVLALAFGWLGIHKIYLRYYAQGLALLGCTLGGPILLAGFLGTFLESPSKVLTCFTVFLLPLLMVLFGMVEGAIYLTTPDGRFAERHIRGRHPWF